MFVEGLQGVAVIADDILVYGEGETIQDATKDHDVKLTKLFYKCKTTGIVKRVCHILIFFYSVFCSLLRDILHFSEIKFSIRFKNTSALYIKLST